MSNRRLIESDSFPIEFLSELGERESWRKEVHRPIYHVHKWWAKRLGSVFRGILLGCELQENSLQGDFYRRQGFGNSTVFDPFMGSGTTVGEAHKLGMTALGRDINPVAVRAVRTGLGPLRIEPLQRAYAAVRTATAERIGDLYRCIGPNGFVEDVLYFFWVMQAPCPQCLAQVDLFPSYIFGRNAYPDKKPEVRVVCPCCGDVFTSPQRSGLARCPACSHAFDAEDGNARGGSATCTSCKASFSVIRALGGGRPSYRLYAKLVLTLTGEKVYRRASDDDLSRYAAASAQMRESVASEALFLPDLRLVEGHNTTQAMNYGFLNWRDFFNDRQLLGLSWLRNAIMTLPETEERQAMLTLFSGTLEFNNMFASYKGEGTGAVRHMFAHHILKPERMPIEANIWGTPKSSGAFSTLFERRLLSAARYQLRPLEVGAGAVPTAEEPSALNGSISEDWPRTGKYASGAVYLSCGDSARTGLKAGTIDMVVTDPPFFDNVHYAELADFFQAWAPTTPDVPSVSTRSQNEVQDADADRFSKKLQGVFAECNRLLKPGGLLVFSYHHSRDDGWKSLAQAILRSGFRVVNSHPIHSEMTGAAPKSQASEPVQLDVILVCRRTEDAGPRHSVEEAMASYQEKVDRLCRLGKRLSVNDRAVALRGQLLSTLGDESQIDAVLSGEPELVAGSAK